MQLTNHGLTTIVLVIYGLYGGLYSSKNFNLFMLYFAIKQVEQKKIPT